ncbi:DUF6252 family protein [Rubrivirga sp. IMCC45206]|uniref:DUF6252 family protein n=1 Tax=Rubrivirga sp. IMCC45206 TaxID=3391614 RepID=UPI00398F9B32
MRTLLPAALFVSLLAVAACDTLGDAVDGAACAASGYADAGTISATVGGAAYRTPCVRVDEASGQVTVASLDDVVSDGGQRLLAVTAPTEVGTFEVGATRAAGVYTARAADPERQADQTYAATSGTVTVASVSATAIAGTFAFSARTPAGETVEVTAGRFDVTF